MTTYVYRPDHELADDNGMVAKQFAGERYVASSAPQVISDHMDQTWHPCDVKQYDSKSKFRQVTRAHGGIEMGTEKIVPRKKVNNETPDHVVAGQIERAIYEIQNPWAKR